MCLISGSNRGKIKWIRKEENLPNDLEFLEDGSLVIPQVTVEDSGVYSCGIQDDDDKFIHLDTTTLVVQGELKFS